MFISFKLTSSFFGRWLNGKVRQIQHLFKTCYLWLTGWKKFQECWHYGQEVAWFKNYGTKHSQIFITKSYNLGKAIQESSKLTIHTKSSGSFFTTFFPFYPHKNTTNDYRDQPLSDQQQTGESVRPKISQVDQTGNFSKSSRCLERPPFRESTHQCIGRSSIYSSSCGRYDV